VNGHFFVHNFVNIVQIKLNWTKFNLRVYFITQVYLRVSIPCNIELADSNAGDDRPASTPTIISTVIKNIKNTIITITMLHSFLYIVSILYIRKKIKEYVVIIGKSYWIQNTKYLRIYREKDLKNLKTE